MQTVCIVHTRNRQGALKNPATLKPLGGTIYGATPSFNPAQFDGGAESN